MSLRPQIRLATDSGIPNRGGATGEGEAAFPRAEISGRWRNPEEK